LAACGVFLAILLCEVEGPRMLLLGSVPFMGLLALCRCWYLALRFVRFGRDSLAAVPAEFWILPILAGAASLVGLWIFFSGRLDLDRETDAIFQWLGLFALGSPAVVPLLHLSAERWLRTINLLESTP